MKEQNTSNARFLAGVVFVVLVVVAAAIVWRASGSAVVGLLLGGLMVVVLVLAERGGSRPLHKRLRTKARGESAPYDEPPDRPLSRWQ